MSRRPSALLLRIVAATPLTVTVTFIAPDAIPAHCGASETTMTAWSPPRPTARKRPSRGQKAPGLLPLRRPYVAAFTLAEIRGSGSTRSPITVSVLLTFGGLWPPEPSPRLSAGTTEVAEAAEFESPTVDADTPRRKSSQHSTGTKLGPSPGIGCVGPAPGPSTTPPAVILTVRLVGSSRICTLETPKLPANTALVWSS